MCVGALLGQSPVACRISACEDLLSECPLTPISSGKRSLKRCRLTMESGFSSPVKGEKQIQNKLGQTRNNLPTKAAIQKQLKVAGPSVVQTLRGRLHGREVALVFCGEAHEDAIDLTRRHAVVEPKQGWLEPQQQPMHDGADFCPNEALQTKHGMTVAGAKRWAEDILDDLDESTKTDGAVLVYNPPAARCKSVAWLFLPGTLHGEPPSPSTRFFEWGDLDAEARAFNQQRLRAGVGVEEQDALIAERKQKRVAQGFELFDDWLLRHASSQDVDVHLVLEAPVPAHELELHLEDSVQPAPCAHNCIRQLEPDSDEDTDQAETPGNGSYLDYVRRRALAHLPRSRVHAVDARVLGDADDSCLPLHLRGSFEALVSKTRRPDACPDAEEVELEACGASWAKSREESNVVKQNLAPSWEAFFGGAADLLYYAPHVKADYTPFLRDCVGSAASMRQFFQALFFETVPVAMSTIKLNEQTRPSAHIRSLALQTPGADILRRPAGHCHSGRQTVPVRAAPVDRYLKARGCEVPRTWVAGIAERLRDVGLGHLVEAAQSWYMATVDNMLSNPKNADVEGDNFVAWLQACHRSIYDDIDHLDPMKLRRCKFAQSKSHPESKDFRYNLKDIGIPGIEQAFEEFRSEPNKSTSRQQVLSKILVDAFQLRSVDLAMVLKSAEVAVRSPPGARVVIVHYAGLDHTRNAVKFWRSQGFSHEGLRNSGVVGKLTEYEDSEPRALTFPTYLRDMEKLFPVPASVPDVDRRMLRPRLGAKRRKLLRHGLGYTQPVA